MSKEIRKRYLKYALIGKKHQKMVSIEQRFPGIPGFTRWRCFMSAIGGHGLWYKNGWIMLLPINQTPRWDDTQYAWSFNFVIIAGYISKYNKKEVIKNGRRN